MPETCNIMSKNDSYRLSIETDLSEEYYTNEPTQRYDIYCMHANSAI